MTVYSEIDTTTSDWTSIPFEVDGINFLSKLRIGSEMHQSVSKIPTRIFQEMNIGAIRDCIGNPSLLSREELVSELYRVNIGGSQAILELA